MHDVLGTLLHAGLYQLVRHLPTPLVVVLVVIVGAVLLVRWRRRSRRSR